MNAERTHARWHRAVRKHQRDALDDDEASSRASSGKADDGAAACVTYHVASGVGGGVAGPGDGGGGAVCLAINGEAAAVIADGDWVAGVILNLDAIGGDAERCAADVYRQRSRRGNVANEPVGTNESCRSHWSSVCTDRITVKSTSTFPAQALWVADLMSIVAPVRPLCPCCRAGSRHALGLPAALYR